jgi:hypothetical protein
VLHAEKPLQDSIPSPRLVLHHLLSTPQLTVTCQASTMHTPLSPLGCPCGGANRNCGGIRKRRNQRSSRFTFSGLVTSALKSTIEPDLWGFCSLLRTGGSGRSHWWRSRLPGHAGTLAKGYLGPGRCIGKLRLCETYSSCPYWLTTEISTFCRPERGLLFENRVDSNHFGIGLDVW